MPCSGLPDLITYGAGLKLYDWIAGRARLAPSRILHPREALRRVPCMRSGGLTGVVSYADGQFDDARFCLAVIQTFRYNGGAAFNYARVRGFEADSRGRIEAARVQDRLSDSEVTIRARVFVNATGPFSDSVRRFANAGAALRIRPSKGIHVLFPLPARWTAALVIPKTEDGRIAFAMPYQGRLLVGTTDEAASAGDDMLVTRREVDYLLRQINPYLSRPLAAEEIVSGFAGLRPLVRTAGNTTTSELIRDDEIEVDARSGLISILGGKWTTYRRMAEKTIDHIKPGGCRTHDCVLVAPDSSSYADADSRPLVEGAPQTRGQVINAVRHELAVTLEDVLARRIGLELFSWRLAAEASPAAAALMARELGWTAAETASAVAAYAIRISRLEAAIKS